MIDFKFDTVVLGGCFESYLYAFYNNLPLIVLKEESYFEFDFIKYSSIFSDLEKFFKKRNNLDINKNILAHKQELIQFIYIYMSYFERFFMQKVQR
jgi:hypothetical protein